MSLIILETSLSCSANTKGRLMTSFLNRLRMASGYHGYFKFKKTIDSFTYQYTINMCCRGKGSGYHGYVKLKETIELLCITTPVKYDLSTTV